MLGSLRDIDAGEELFWDYTETDNQPDIKDCGQHLSASDIKYYKSRPGLSALKKELIEYKTYWNLIN